MTTTGGRRAATDWVLVLALAAITILLILQYSKQAMLPRTQTPALWGAEAAVVTAALVLRSGWGRDSGWKEEQLQLGTLANNYYPPRREALINGFAVGIGVLLALWWGTATWGVVLGGMRRGAVGRGLLDFEIATAAGAITGGLVGAAIGLAVGHVWESRHRRERLERRNAHA
jgi:hypothetical protein